MMMFLNEFMSRLRLAKESKTIYVTGGQGQPATPANKAKMIKNYAKNATEKKAAQINNASADTFFFDCCGLIKSILWGWNANQKLTMGGAKYKSNGVPDESTEAMFDRCSSKVTLTPRKVDTSKLKPGMLLWFKGHVGIYTGNGLCIDSTETGDGVAERSVNFQPWCGAGWYPFIEAPSKPVTAGATVTIKKGAVYGGQGSARGKAVPVRFTVGQRFTVKKVGFNFSVREALVKELNSWIACDMLETI